MKEKVLTVEEVYECLMNRKAFIYRGSMYIAYDFYNELIGQLPDMPMRTLKAAVANCFVVERFSEE